MKSNGVPKTGQTESAPVVVRGDTKSPSIIWNFIFTLTSVSCYICIFGFFKGSETAARSFGTIIGDAPFWLLGTFLVQKRFRFKAWPPVIGYILLIIWLFGDVVVLLNTPDRLWTLFGEVIGAGGFHIPILLNRIRIGLIRPILVIGLIAGICMIANSLYQQELTGNDLRSISGTGNVDFIKDALQGEIYNGSKNNLLSVDVHLKITEVMSGQVCLNRQYRIDGPFRPLSSTPFSIPIGFGHPNGTTISYDTKTISGQLMYQARRPQEEQYRFEWSIGSAYPASRF